jgi:hypothetical protein
MGNLAHCLFTKEAVDSDPSYLNASKGDICHLTLTKGEEDRSNPSSEGFPHRKTTAPTASLHKKGKGCKSPNIDLGLW